MRASLAAILLLPLAAGLPAAPAHAQLRQVLGIERGIDEPWTGDFDGMVKRGYIRMLVVPSRTSYFVDRGTQRGVTHDAGKYLRTDMDRYFPEVQFDPLNRCLFAFASYNAGPNRIAKLRKEAAKRGLDPNVWFSNVELVVAERVGQETVRYVSNIFKYYVAYELVVEAQAERERAQQDVQAR